jgi:hypothetical protein
MAMMPPTIVVAAASAPPVMMTATIVAPTVTVATSDLDNRLIGASESIRCCGGHCGRRSSRSKATECSKSNKCKFEFHGFLLPVAF